MPITRPVALALALLLALPASAVERSRAAKDSFKHDHPCPATGSARGSCTGYVVDHVQPLCAGGADAPINMQWQTVADAKVKDRSERKTCASRR